MDVIDVILKTFLHTNLKDFKLSEVLRMLVIFYKMNVLFFLSLT